MYGISQIDYDVLFFKQEGCCILCGRHHSILKQTLSVDHCHCHTTGKARGLLCGSCNRALGLFKDNVVTLEKAITYLKEVV